MSCKDPNYDMWHVLLKLQKMSYDMTNVIYSLNQSVDKQYFNQ